MNRRNFLGTTLAAVNLPLALSLGLLRPAKVLAGWPGNAFSATALEDALAELSIGPPLAAGDAVEIQAPEIAEDGSSVPVTVESRIPGTRSIIFLSEKNPNPAVARFTFGPRAEARVTTRIKMGASGDIVAVVESGDGYFTARRSVKVTLGGCG